MKGEKLEGEREERKERRNDEERNRGKFLILFTKTNLRWCMCYAIQNIFWWRGLFYSVSICLPFFIKNSLHLWCTYFSFLTRGPFTGVNHWTENALWPNSFHLSSLNIVPSLFGPILFIFDYIGTGTIQKRVVDKKGERGRNKNIEERMEEWSVERRTERERESGVV